MFDFHERSLPDLTQRTVDMPALSGKIDAIIGMRRTGKTWFLFQVMQQYLEQGIAKESMLYINFDDERLFPLTAQHLGGISDAYYRLYPHMREQRCYFFFDEIQNVTGWEHYLRRLVDHEYVQIAVTGSSAKLLSREIATSLRGRSISTEIFPFSFKEMLQHEGIAAEVLHQNMLARTLPWVVLMSILFLSAIYCRVAYEEEILNTKRVKYPAPSSDVQDMQP